MPYTTINKSTDYFNTKLYTGNGSTNAITGVGFQPDLVWLKARSYIDDHYLFNVIRGTGKYLISNQTASEGTNANTLSSFDSDGFTLGSDGGPNSNTSTYASWNWLGANGTASNTDGSITSNVSVNTTSGFSIVSYTGNGTAGATIGHGLGVSPSWIVTKKRNATGSWVVYHKSQGATKYGILDTTAAFSTGSTLWNDTEPTSSVFSVGTDADTNGSVDNYIAYCFAEKTGYSKFGSYTGNGSTDGPFVYTGFKPAFVIQKESGNTRDWTMIDNKRSSFNEMDDRLVPNANTAEVQNNSIDFLSNGFKMRTTQSNSNGSGGSYIYMAFGQSLVGSNNVPCTAR